MQLTAEDLAKIKASTVKIVTYHPLSFLDRDRKQLS
jgi:hypothetical protein